MKSSFRIANITFGKSTSEATYFFEWQNKSFEVQRFSANFSVELIKDLIRNLRNDVDAFAISDLPAAMNLAGNTFVHRQSLEIMATPTSVPLCDGSTAKEISILIGLEELVKTKKIDPSRGIFFPLGMLNLEAVRFLKEDHSEHLRFGDTYAVLGLPFAMNYFAFENVFSRIAARLVNMKEIRKQTPMAIGELKKLSRQFVLNANLQSDVIFSDVGVLALMGKDLRFIERKTVVVPQTYPYMNGKIAENHPANVIDLFPNKYKLNENINYAVLDAMIRLSNSRSSTLSKDEWMELLKPTESYTNLELKKYLTLQKPSLANEVQRKYHRIQQRISKDKAPDFAFVVHALSQEDLFRLPGAKLLRSLSPESKNSIEKWAAKAPGFAYGSIRQIISQKNNREINGIIYGLAATPKMMKSEPPEVTYEKIEKICKDAASRGAKIIGLGAYTKVVGDSGATIQKNSPIPVTTGNSLSSAATLWAVHEVAQKMGLIEVDSSGQLNATAMVIGATGSIGKVSAKLLSLAFPRLVLVGTRIERLQELKLEIEKMSPRCEIQITIDADPFAKDIDVLVTATSALDHKIIDVLKLKPGCIVCDCSRPLDFDIIDAMKRPDILIIESGEVILPGPVQLTCDLGLPDDSVYACLGETAVLALEEKYEPFTIGRDIEWTKVKQIYKLSKEHGVKLAAIRGHAGIITDREIEIARNLAIQKRKK